MYDSLRTIHGDTLEISPYNYPTMKSYLTVDTTAVEALMGDVNEDNTVDVLDVMSVVGYILLNEDNIDFYAADVNYDSYINILDVIGVINIIVGTRNTSRIAFVDNPYLESPEEITATESSGMVVPMRLRHLDGIAGLQFAINRSSGDFVIDDIIINGVTGGDYQQIMTDSSVLVIAYSLAGSSLSEDEIEVIVNLSFGQETSGSIAIQSLIASDLSGNPISVNMENPLTTVRLVPDQFTISNAYPNPFNPTTNFNIGIPERGLMSATVYDINGRFISYLVNAQHFEAGFHSITWAGVDHRGVPVSNGIYFIRFTKNKNTEIKRVLLLK